METLTASDAKREFGEMLLKAQHEPIAINRNGKPVAVMISAVEYERLEALKKICLKSELAKGMKSLKKGNLLDGDTVFKELEEYIENAPL